MVIENLNKYFDHTLLKPTATKSEVEQLCNEAKENDFATVCVNPYWVKLAHQNLANSSVGVTTVVGFPLGATSTKAKVEETKQAVLDGASEIDMVINLGALLDNDFDTVKNDISAVKEACEGRVLKVILETGFLTPEQIEKACQLAMEAKADFVKTSTGFGPRGASVADVQLMKQAVQDQLKVKASGGIRHLADVQAMIEAGADRIGTSGSVAIMKEQKAN